MLAPGSKGWIAKYLQLVEAGTISVAIQKPTDFNRSQFNHYVLAQTGIIFGYPSKLLFGNELDQSKWTKDEQLTVLLFEGLIFTHLNANKTKTLDSVRFLNDLELFYKNHRIQSLNSLLGYFFKESKSEKIERVLAKRAEVPKYIIRTKTWMNVMNNAFIYLDILLFESFLKAEEKQPMDYQQLATLSLAIIALSAYSDGLIEENEKALFEAFLISADLDHDERELAKMRFKNGISLNELTPDLIDSWNFKRYLLDLSALTIFSGHEPEFQERAFLSTLRDWLGCSERDLDEAIFMAQQFVLENHSKVGFLHDSSAVELMVDNVSKRWIKILGRNKDKLAQELRQSKELVFLIRKSATTELSKEEKEKVRIQFMDLVKSMPSLAIFLLPGGALLLPIVLKIIPNLVPSAFKENELEE